MKEKRRRYWIYFLSSQILFVTFGLTAFKFLDQGRSTVTNIVLFSIAAFGFTFLDRIRVEEGDWKPLIVGIVIFGVVLAITVGTPFWLGWVTY